MVRTLPAAALTFALVILPACKPSGNEAYAEALILLGEAERGPCESTFDKSGQQVISVSQIGDCLTKTNEGLEKLHEAKRLGVDHRELEDLIAKTEGEIERLEGMKATVLRMQNNLGFKHEKPQP